MNIPIALATLAVIVLLASCKKEENSSNNNNVLEGNYKLKYLTSSQNSTNEGSLGEKAVLLTDFTTINNQGNIEFSSSTFSGTGVGYEVNTESKYYLYDGANLLDSTSLPLNWVLAPTNIKAPYQLIGTDSIYFPRVLLHQVWEEQVLSKAALVVDAIPGTATF